MADAFDRFLESGLGPPERDPDRHFVARVQAMIALEERMAAQRRSIAGALLRQLLGLLAVGAAAIWIGKAVPVASWFDQSPAAALAVLLIAFGSLVALFGGTGAPSAVSRH